MEPKMWPLDRPSMDAPNRAPLAYAPGSGRILAQLPRAQGDRRIPVRGGNLRESPHAARRHGRRVPEARRRLSRLVCCKGDWNPAAADQRPQVSQAAMTEAANKTRQPHNFQPGDYVFLNICMVGNASTSSKVVDGRFCSQLKIFSFMCS